MTSTISKRNLVLAALLVLIVISVVVSYQLKMASVRQFIAGTKLPNSLFQDKNRTVAINLTWANSGFSVNDYRARYARITVNNIIEMNSDLRRLGYVDPSRDDEYNLKEFLDKEGVTFLGTIKKKGAELDALQYYAIVGPLEADGSGSAFLVEVWVRY